MNIGILTPSVYMYQKKFGGRIFAPGDLARGLVKNLVKRGHTVYWFTAPEDSLGSTLISGDVNLLEQSLKMRSMQDIKVEFLEQVSLFGKKMYY